MKKVGFAFFMVFMVLWSCEDRDDNLTTANIRIRNSSTVDFNTVTVRVDSLIFENIPAQGVSDYQEFEVAFEQDALQIVSDSAQYSFEPTELSAPLPMGLYTYDLDISDTGEVIFNFRIDD